MARNRRRVGGDLLIRGGTLHALDGRDPAGPDAALEIRAGRVVGRCRADLAGLPVLDLEGRTAVPGFIDAHAHVLALGRLREELDLRACGSFEDLVARVAGHARTLPAGRPVRGHGWDQERWRDRALPHHRALSAALPDREVVLRRVDGHAVLLAGLALEQARLAEAGRGPEGGEIVRDEAGEPTGVLVDAAMALAPRRERPHAAAARGHALAAQEACLQAGLTCVHDAGVDEAGLEALAALEDEGALLLRLRVMLAGEFESGRPSPWLADRLARGIRRGDRLCAGAVKLFADGALGSRGAALLAAYEDRPGSSGLAQLPPDELEARIRVIAAAGFQPAVHAIGDAANRAVLDAYERVLVDLGAGDHRFRVEHAQVVHPRDVPRFGALRLVASVQPAHAVSDATMAPRRLGAQRMTHAYPWRALAEAGAALALGSDFPVEEESPLRGWVAAVTAEPARRLSRAQALEAATRGAAFAAFDENLLGSLAPGHAADFVVLSADPLSCPDEELPSLRVEETWIDGLRAHPPADVPTQGLS